MTEINHEVLIANGFDKCDKEYRKTIGNRHRLCITEMNGIWFAGQERYFKWASQWEAVVGGREIKTEQDLKDFLNSDKG